MAESLSLFFRQATWPELAAYLAAHAAADGFIVGSCLKAGGRWSEPVDPRRVERFMAAHARCA